MSTKKYALICIVLIIAGFILAPVTTGGVTADEFTMSYKVEAFLPVTLSLIAFAVAAVFAGITITKFGQSKSVALNPLVSCVGLGCFGLFYGFYVVYSDAAEVLENYNNTWIREFGYDSEIERFIPKYAQEFKSTSNTYMLLMLAAVAVIGVGGYMLYKSWKAVQQ